MIMNKENFTFLFGRSVIKIEQAIKINGRKWRFIMQLLHLLVLGDLCKEFNINKFPTLKYFRHGALAKKEYRGARSVKSLGDFVESNILPIFIPIASTAELDTKVEVDVLQLTIVRARKLQ